MNYISEFTFNSFIEVIISNNFDQLDTIINNILPNNEHKNNFIFSQKDKRKIHFLLLLSIAHSRLNFVKFFHAMHNCITMIDNLAFKNACCIGNIEIITFLQKNGADLHVNNNYPLQIAASNGHLQVVDFLLEKGANINANNNNAIKWANRNKQIEMVQLLIKFGANPKDVDNTFPLDSYIITIVPYESTFTICRKIITVTGIIKIYNTPFIQ